MEAHHGSAGVRRPLNTLVSDLATRLLGADAATVADAYRLLLCDLVNVFDMDTCFLRHNDAAADATVMVAEWPPRSFVPDPDPLGVVRFADADPVFAVTRTQTQVQIYRPSDQPEDYRERIEEGSGVPATTVVTVPLLGAGKTLGVLGFVCFEDREWTPDELAAVTAVGAMLAQVQRRVAAENELRNTAMYDELTGLLNRHGLGEHLAELVDAGSTVGILFVDIDRLAALNDFLGHRMGDQFLRTVAQRLRARLPDNDVVARLGGDEFVVVLGGTPSADVVAARAEAVRALVAEPMVIGDDRVTRTASIGVSVGTGDPSELLRQADQAALQVKSAGGNAVVLYSDAIAASNDLRNDIELTLGWAIAHDKLILHFQPEVDLRTGTVVAVEALVRWPHPTRGLLGPDVFVPIADASNLAADLGRWVIDAACRAYVGWREKTGRADLVLRINISPVHLAVTGFARGVQRVLDHYGIPARLVCLELSEVAVVDSVAGSGAALMALREIGVLTAIDHFGVGYSSLLHLKRLPLDVLKIDRHFTDGLGIEGDDRALVSAMIGLATSLRLDVVANGVETTRAARMLVASGCHRAQGHAICPPVDDDAFTALLVDGSPLIDLSVE
ncbi:putative bifunctional diguanylate cyclase/phosphodiesterase [Rhodococcus sp. MEB064]|uniref:putative bifunctional diguanylate cyclase/phosphodiesterase n=1 Tax=Rhodococcus sp. MEB064 TaxID=1587522 RepID=UPI0005AC7125|nr:EAL domain-containing protein [Rhodococcus sp. MEB064]